MSTILIIFTILLISNIWISTIFDVCHITDIYNINDIDHILDIAYRQAVRPEGSPYDRAGHQIHHGRLGRAWDERRFPYNRLHRRETWREPHAVVTRQWARCRHQEPEGHEVGGGQWVLLQGGRSQRDRTESVCRYRGRHQGQAAIWWVQYHGWLFWWLCHRRLYIFMENHFVIIILWVAIWWLCNFIEGHLVIII